MRLLAGKSMSEPTRLNRRSALVLATFAIFSVAGCDKSAPSEPPAGSASSAAPTPAAPSASPPPAAAPSTAEAAGTPGDVTPIEPGLLPGHLAQEARNRQKVKPSVEDVFSAFEALGAPVPKKEQTVASTWKASYCVGGYTAAHDMSINVCEYADAAGATAGRDMHEKVFPNMATLQTWSHKSTTLAIIEMKHDAPTDAIRKKLSDAFLAM